MFHTAVCAHLDLHPSAQTDYRGLIVYGAKNNAHAFVSNFTSNQTQFFLASFSFFLLPYSNL